MPSLKEIKTRIASVNNTRKITSAMKMVSSSKLHHAQTMIENMLPYETTLDHILKTYLASEPDVYTIYQQPHTKLQKVALVVFTSNSSLCGGFNNNVIRLFLQIYNEYSEMLGKDNVLVYPIGRKVFDKVKKLGIKPQGEYSALADKPNAQECRVLAESLRDDFRNNKLDRVELIYHHFRSAASHILTREQFLPININLEELNRNDRDLTRTDASKASLDYLKEKGGHSTSNDIHADYKPQIEIHDNFIVEPDIPTVLSQLIPKELNLKMYTALLDSNACEHAARMIAMQTATDNADELLRQLNLQYNKSRQNAITSELLDIVAGSQN